MKKYFLIFLLLFPTLTWAAPTITITSPGSGVTYNNGSSSTCTLAGTHTDASTIVYDNIDLEFVDQATVTDGTNWTAGTINLEPGTNEILVTVTDSSGDVRTDTITITYTPTICPAISNLSEVADPVNMFEKFELQFDLVTTAKNYYEYYAASVPAQCVAGRGVTVTCTFTSPSSTTIDVPGFWYEGADAVGDWYSDDANAYKHDADDNTWCVRFSPTEVGTWSYSISVTDSSGTIASPATGTFTARAPVRKGFIQVASDNRYFEFSGTGELWWPLGPAEISTTDGFDSYAGKGCNNVRNWMEGENAYGDRWNFWVNVGEDSGNEGWATYVDYDTAYTGHDLSRHIKYELDAIDDGDGVCDSGSHADETRDVMTDASLSLDTDELAGFYIYNDTDGSRVRIKSNTATAITSSLGGLTGGTDNEWETGDNYHVENEHGGLWVGYSNKKYYNGFTDGTDYQVIIRLKTSGIVQDQAGDYGLTIRSNNYAVYDGSSWADYFNNLVDDGSGNTGAGTMGSFPYITTTRDWHTIVHEFTASSDEAADNYLYVFFKNCTAGEAWIDYITIKEKEGSDYENHIVSAHSADYHKEINPAPCKFFDKTVEEAEENEVYLRYVILDKNDWLAQSTNADGTFTTWGDGDGYDAAIATTKIKWHYKQWWRYVLARWGYSTAIFSWEYCNEGPPTTSAWYDAADDWAEWMKDLEDGGNEHLYSYSGWNVTWSSSMDTYFTTNAPHIDMGDWHRYNYSGDGFDEDDNAAFFISITDTYDDNPLDKPIMLGETAIHNGGGGELEAYTSEQGNEGVFLHNPMWLALGDEPIFSSQYWHSSHLDEIDGGIVAVTEPFYKFIKDLDVQHGGYADVAATGVASGISVYGQKNTTKGKAHFLVRNDDYSWCNASGSTDYCANYTAITPVSDTFQVTLSASTEYIIEEWDTWAGTFTTSVVESDGSGNIDIAVTSLADDIAFKIYPPKWETRGGNQSRHYNVPYEPASGSNLDEVRWRIFLGERIEVEMEPLVSGDYVYIGLMNGKLYSRDRSNGTANWVYSSGGPITDTPHIFYDKDDNWRITFGALDGKLYCLDSDGEEVWTYDTGSPIMSTPIEYLNMIFVGNLDGEMNCVDASTGAELWVVDVGESITSTPALGEVSGDLEQDQKAIFFQTGDNEAFAYRTNGTELWNHTMSGAFTKRTYAVCGQGSSGKNVVSFVTRKPGNDCSIHDEDKPTSTYPTRRNGADAISAWNTWYGTYPDRRALYFLNGDTGADLWSGSNYTPLLIPYWGEYNVMVDSSNRMLFGGGGIDDSGLDHDERLWRMDIETGAYTQLQDKDSSTWMCRTDEVGRWTLVDDRVYEACSEDVGYYDISSSVATCFTILGNNWGTHRNPHGLSDEPVEVFSGDHKHFTRYGSSTPGGLGGANDATSALVVAGDEAYITMWGYLYNLTADSVTPSHVHGTLDHVSVAPNLNKSRATIKNNLNSICQSIVDAHTADSDYYIQPTARHWWHERPNETDTVLNKYGFSLRVLSEALDYLDEPLKTSMISYLRDHIDTNIKNTNWYAYAKACVDYEDGLELTCNSSGIETEWYRDNGNDIANRIYGLYKYYEKASTWGELSSEGDLAFITSYMIPDLSLGSWQADDGFIDLQPWHNGIWKPQHQMAGMYALTEIYDYNDDSTLNDSYSGTYKTYYDAMVAAWTTSGGCTNCDGSDGWGDYVRSLHPGIDISYSSYQDWGYQQSKHPCPAEGTNVASNDYRMPIDLQPIAYATGEVYSWNIKNWRMHGFHPFYTEFNSMNDTFFSDNINDFIAMIEKYNDWWYMGDYSHIVTVGRQEEDSFSHVMAADMFQAKIYIQGESFEDMVDYLPWKFEDQGYEDIYYIQNMTALLSADWSSQTRGAVTFSGTMY